MQLEQKHVGISFTAFHPSYPPPIESVREIKICEQCAKRFFRTVTLLTDENGILRRVGPVTCNECGSLDYVSQKIKAQDVQAIQEIAENLKESVLRYRHRGAPIEKVVGRGEVREKRKWARWRDLLRKSLQICPEGLTAREIGTIYGNIKPWVIQAIRNCGFPLIVIGKKPVEGRIKGPRTVNLYGLETTPR